MGNHNNDEYVFPRKETPVEEYSKGSIAHHVISNVITWGITFVFGVFVPFLMTPVLNRGFNLIKPSNQLPTNGQPNKTPVDLGAENFVDNILSQLLGVVVVMLVVAFIYIIVLVFQLRIAVINGGVLKASAVAGTVLFPIVVTVVWPLYMAVA